MTVNTRLWKTILLAATMAVAGFDTRAFAQTSDGGVVPEVFAGNVTCTTPEIVAYCDLSNPVELAITPPKNNATNIFTTGNVTRPAFSGRFEIALTVAGNNTFSFVDQSLRNTSPPGGTPPFFPAENQQADTPGVECVISRSSSLANVYRRVNWPSDSGLMPPSGSLGQIRFCWSEGACKETQTNVGTSCGDWNENDSTPGADFLQGHLATPEQPINLCGCFSPVRLCDSTVPAEEGGCFAAGSGLTSIDTQAATTASSETAAPTTSDFSILATTSCPSGQCLTTKTYKIGGTTVSSQVCVAERTTDSDTICP
jgi:hypothetical protein